MVDIFDDRIGRLISLGRAALAIGSLATVMIGAAQPTTAVYLLAAYAGLSMAVAALQMSHRLRTQTWGLALHLADLVIFTVLLYLTDGPISPFFPLLVFALLSAMLRWQWRGVLRTTVALLTLYVWIGFVFQAEVLVSTLGMQRFAMRTLQLAVIGTMLTAFSYYQGRISRDIMRMNTLTPEPADDEVVPIKTSLSYASYIYKAGRVIFAWSDGVEPWLYLSEWRNGRLESSSVPPDQFDPLVADKLNGRPFVYRRGRAAVLCDDRGRLVRSRDTTISPAFLERFGIGNAVVLPITAHGIEGWMFIIVDRTFPPEALAIAPILDAQIAAIFDKAAARAANRRATTSEQRLRLARDLHDGILQFLAGLAMQIESIVNSAKDDKERFERLRTLQNVLLMEQRELRTFIRGLRPDATPNRNSEIELAPDLTALAKRLQDQWRINIDLTVEPPSMTFPIALHYDIHQLAREAVANAVRHGNSGQIEITAGRDNGVLNLTIADDGCGLGFEGTFDARQLTELDIGPRSLRERICSLGGTFHVTSSSLGTLLRMTVPLAGHERNA